ncbi:MAG: hypothetical protein HY324_00390, partial [Chlamydiia bacterium]|nr:hypothetical protein [Chlamydiia bacterium]
FYAYVHNDPLIHSDLFGLMAQDLDKGWTYIPIYSPSDGSYVDPCTQRWWQTQWPSPPGFTPEAPKYSPHYYVNGIGNDYFDHLQGARGLKSSLGKEANVIPYHSKSFGWTEDLHSVFQSRRETYTHDGIEKLRLTLQLELACMEIKQDPRKLFITCFSRGATDVWHAVKDFSQEQKNRLVITACGPTLFLPRDLGFSVINLVSRSDWCSRFMANDFLYGKHPTADVIYLPPSGGHSLFQREHYFLNHTYQQGLRDHTQPLYEQFGAPGY